MADAEVQVRFSADTHDLVTATSGMRDIVGEMEAFDVAGQKMATTSAEATESMGGLRLATAGVSREIIVLGHEVVSGNFSRIPGSLLVLSSRMGGLNLATVGWTAAVVVAVGALYEMAAAIERTEGFMVKINDALDLSGRSYAFSTEAIKQEIDQLHQLPGVSEAAARSMALELARSARLTSNDIQFLIQNVQKFSIASGEEIPSAMKTLSTALENPITSLKKLDNEYNILTPSQENARQGFEKIGDTASAKSLLIKSMSDRLREINTTMTPLQKSANNLKLAWDSLMQSFGNSSGLKWLIDTGLPKFIEGLATSEKYLEYIYKGKSGQTFGQYNQDKKDAAAVEKIPMRDQGSDTIQAKDEANQKNILMKDEMEKARQAKQQGLADSRRMYQEDYTLFSENEHTQAALKNLTAEEEYQALAQAKGREWALEKKSYDDEMHLYSTRSKEYQKLKDEELQAEKKFQIDVAKLQLQYAQASKAHRAEELSDWKRVISSTTSTFGRGITDMITGTQTFTQVAQGMARSLLSSFIDMMAKKAELWIADQILGTATAEGQAIANIQADAATTFAAAYASTSAIPIVGPALAPGVAASSSAAALAGGLGLLAYAQGAWEIPHDQLALVHQGETIVPKNFAQGMRENGVAAGGGGADSHVHFHVQAMDAKGVNAFFNQHGDKIAKTVMSSLRNGNRGSRNNLRF